MTINKYFAFNPVKIAQEKPKNTNVISDKEAQRQALVKQAQQAGGL